MKKALIVTTVSGFVPQFEMNNVKLLQSMEYEIHYASNFNMPVYSDNNDRLNGTDIVCHQVDFVRSPFRVIKNIHALMQLTALMNEESYDLMHCHTPMGGVLARIAAKRTKVSRVLYTAHGFHFYKGASLFHWLMFYPVERWLAQYTDVLITINREDYKRAKRFKLHKNGEAKYIPGVGVDLKKGSGEKERKYHTIMIRKELGINKDAFVITSIGELTNRKNHCIILKAVARLKDQCPQVEIKYIICGTGVLEQKLRTLSEKLGISNQVVFAGYRMDVQNILQASDCFAFPSRQEGLPVALMEAMAEGLPVVCSRIRGNVDLIKEGKNGFLIGSECEKLYAEKIMALILDKNLRVGMGRENCKRIKGFTKEKVQEIMKRIYLK